MVRYGSDAVAFLLLDGMDILGTNTEIDIDKEAVLEDVTTLGIADEAWAAVGIKRGALTQKGFYDDAANSSNAALVGVGTSRVACIGLEGNTLGKKFIGWAGAIVAKYVRQASRSAFHKADADFQVSGPVEDGVILHRLEAETTDPGTETSHDNAASSANGGSGYLEVTALTLGGFTNVVIKIRHSTDNSVFVDLITFTAVTAAPAAQRLTVAGTINRYTRTEWDFTGAGAGQSVSFMTGLFRAP
jgi:hypothetical protein